MRARIALPGLLLALGASCAIGCAAPEQDAPSFESPSTDRADTDAKNTKPRPKKESDDSTTDRADGPAEVVKAAQADGTVLYTLGRYSVIVDNRDPARISDAISDHWLDVYLAVYEPMAKRFDPSAPKRTRVTFDPAYDGAAAAANGEITVSSEYAAAHATDVDVMTHEAFHLIQDYDHYSEAGCPAWAVEGFADWARHEYGRENAAGGWALPDVTAEHQPTDGYRVTGRFFLWLQNRDATFVTKLHSTLKANSYSDAFWTRTTGKSLDETWADYVASPELNGS